MNSPESQLAHGWRVSTHGIDRPGMAAPPRDYERWTLVAMTNLSHSIPMADPVCLEATSCRSALTLADTGFFDNARKISAAIVLLLSRSQHR